MFRTYFRWFHGTIFLSAFLPLIATVCSRLIYNEPVTTEGFPLKMGVYLAGVLMAYGMALLLARRFRPELESASEGQALFLDNLPDRLVPWSIFLAAAISLLFELVVIRWQASIFTLFAFYKNVGLLSCFAGLGLGYALAKRPAIPLMLTTLLMSWQVGLLLLLRYSGDGMRSRSLMASPVVEQLNMEFVTATGAPMYVAIYSFLTIVFLMTALTFVPVGQLCGRLMTRRENLPAYGLNLLGSLAGVSLSFVLGFFWTPPVVWFGLALLALALFQIHSNRAILLTATGTTLTLMLLAWPVNSLVHQVYSPYQLIELSEQHGRIKISASGIHYQNALDLSDANPARDRDPFLRSQRYYYEMPYRIHGNVQKAVLVGAGAGNDVAGALRMNVANVDAIEIDPVILALGTTYHPEKPYDDHRTHAVVNDARSHFRSTEETYDAVVYGFLDSHALLSHASNIRVDSYVYTVEGLREARARLNEGGVLSLTLNVLNDQLGRKVYLMMEEAFEGRAPWCIRARSGGYDSVTFVQGKHHDATRDQAFLDEVDFEDCTAVFANTALMADVSTDDWPFLYMPQKVYPVSYLGMMGQVAVLSLLLIMSFFKSRPQFSHATFFFLGAGFMLVETKGITELGLTFGNTWHVIGLVIAGILSMAFLANWSVQVFKFEKPWIPFALLIASLALGYICSRLGGFPPTLLGKIAAIVVLTCPIFFSGLLFSITIRFGKNMPSIMAINLIGAMMGGLLEYNSMYFGFQFLYVLAGIMYALAMISYKLKPMKVSG